MSSYYFQVDICIDGDSFGCIMLERNFVSCEKFLVCGVVSNCKNVVAIVVIVSVIPDSCFKCNVAKRKVSFSAKCSWH